MKNDKKLQIIKLILQGYSTAQIARKTGYSIGAIRNIYTELREGYNVNSKTEIALCYVAEKVFHINAKFDAEFKDLISILPKKRAERQ